MKRLKERKQCVELELQRIRTANGKHTRLIRTRDDGVNDLRATFTRVQISNLYSRRLLIINTLMLR